MALLLGASVAFLLADAGAVDTSGKAASGAAGSSGAAAGAAATAGGPGGSGPRGGPGAPFSAEGQLQRQAQLAMWQGRYERAEQVYLAYRDATRYPHDSRPIAEHPDQVRPFAPVAEEVSLRKPNGEPVRGVRLRTTQERVFLSGAETVRFTLEGVNEEGRAMPLLVTRAAAQSVPDTRTPVPLISAGLTFVDNGSGADQQAGDGVHSAQLSPSQQGFSAYAGTIRVLAQVTAGGESGVAHFDVIYTPGVPATWAGFREAVENGSLNFYLKVNVSRPGRYVASARVDDANGNPFALLQFNEEVAAGPQEFRLQVFGALLRDKAPVFPLGLRDVEGFLLLPDQFPDRVMMARQVGTVYRSASYALSRFSTDEWRSEERDRHLAEYARDAEAAKTQVQRLQGR